jgi:hypothetical protein
MSNRRSITSTLLVASVLTACATGADETAGISDGEVKTAVFESDRRRDVQRRLWKRDGDRRLQRRLFDTRDWDRCPLTSPGGLARGRTSEMKSKHEFAFSSDCTGKHNGEKRRAGALKVGALELSAQVPTHCPPEHT